ncbi:ead/Ea22-like family protein [Cronobacter malonaticus]|nr:ead/Ea22-like family protein [Cronobacter malonaticus]
MKPTYEELEARCAALAAEVYDLKHPGTYLPTKRETPALDAFLREVKSQARQEGAYFVANRMLAAWDAGFIEDTAKNAADIARMIITSTEFMADAPDGDFDRAFADSVLAEIASELRQGGAA